MYFMFLYRLHPGLAEKKSLTSPISYCTSSLHKKTFFMKTVHLAPWLSLVEVPKRKKGHSRRCKKPPKKSASRKDSKEDRVFCDGSFWPHRWSICVDRPRDVQGGADHPSSSSDSAAAALPSLRPNPCQSTRGGIRHTHAATYHIYYYLIFRYTI